MQIIKVKNYDQMSEEALKIVLDVVKNKPDAVLGLATGSTPLGLYAKMIEDHKNNGTSYAECRTVNLDEYVGLDVNSDQSYVYFMRENLFKSIDIKLENTHIENGKAEDKDICQVSESGFNKLWEKYEETEYILEKAKKIIEEHDLKCSK